jgi:predicted Holliday junction resolvase-like endonuclease
MKGQIAEQFARFLPRLSSGPEGLRSGIRRKPGDFLVFNGMDEQNITDLVFEEVKTGTSRHTLRVSRSKGHRDNAFPG